MENRPNWWLILGIVLIVLGMISSLFLEGDRPQPWGERRSPSDARPPVRQDGSIGRETPAELEPVPRRGAKEKRGVEYFQ